MLRGVLTIRVTGELNELEIDQLQAAATQAVAQWIKFRVLIILEDFDSRAARPAGDGAVFMRLDRHAVEKIAIVGDDEREDAGRLFLGENLSAAAVGYFAPADRDQAVLWIVDGLPLENNGDVSWPSAKTSIDEQRSLG